MTELREYINGTNFIYDDFEKSLTIEFDDLKRKFDETKLNTLLGYIEKIKRFEGIV